MPYKQASLTSDIVLWTGENANLSFNVFIFLIKRKNEPFKDMLALPGGFVDIDKETFKEAAIRELFEETNILEKYLREYNIIMDSPNRDPRCRVITKVFGTYINDNKIKELKAKDDATEIVKVNINDICSDKIKLAFDHNEIIRKFEKQEFK
jgi:8-oxo-dGTP diphosphatase